MDKYPLVRKGLTVGIILLFVIINIISSTAQELEKPSLSTSSGNWLYVGGSGPGNYTKIQDAIDNASDGDIVFVYNDSSPYYENICINKSIGIIGEDRNSTIIDGDLIEDVIKINNQNVQIKGFTIKNSKRGYSGISVKTILNNIEGNILSCNYIGIVLLNSSFNMIIDNLFIDNLDGITFIEKSKNNLIKHCRFINNVGGICFLNSHKNSEITNNSFLGNKNDIEFDSFSIWNKIYFNNFMGNGIIKHWSYFNFNLYKNNYWYDWKGISPYHVSGLLNWDWHPAKNPYDIP